MKRNLLQTLFAMLLCVSLLFCMISCDGNEGDESVGTSQSTDETQETQSNEPGGESTEAVTADFSKNY